mgnify:CR=1 FL=1|tara:strand:- start:7 stop:402 length:396 start_codon:yes stop_codon:yes gene_type:complete
MTANEIQKLERACIDYLYIVLKTKEDPGFYPFAKRCLQNHLTTNLCNTNSYFTGMTSTESLKLPKSKRTKEHHYGMTRLAKDLLDLVNPTIDAIKTIVLSRGTFNLTTAKENMILRNNNQDYTAISSMIKY